MREGFRNGVAGAALAGLIVSATSAVAVERVKTVSIVSAAAVSAAADADLRNAADPKGFAGDAAPAKPAERGEMSVTVDRAKVIRLPERTQTVIIGNPAVADIAVQKSGVVVLTGKSFGVTNFIALDATGNMLAESTVSVQAPSDSILVVQRGLDRYTYSCTPACQPSVALGDTTGYFSDTKGQADLHSAFAGQK